MPTPIDPKPNPAAPEGATPLKDIAAEKAGALHPRDSVETAGERMREHETGVWPVVEDRKLVGMIDRKNPDWRLGGEGHDPKTWKVGEIMNHEAMFCYEDEDCTAAQRIMEERELQFLPVVDRDMRILGIFSRDEIRREVERTRSAQGSEGKS